MKKKTALKCRTWTKNFARLEYFFHTSISRSLENSDMNKNHSFRSAFHFSSAPKLLINFFTRFISRFKNHYKKKLKKGLLQYSSSSRKKDSAPIQFKFFEL